MDASAIILAAGAGTRMKSQRPKVLHEVLGKPLVRWVVDAAHEAGIEEVVCVLGHGRDQVEPYVAGDTQVAVQEQRLGTADAVAAASDVLTNHQQSVLVLSGDCPLITAETIQELARKRAEADAGVVVLTMQAPDPTGYGRIVRDAKGQVERIVEQKDCTDTEACITECNAGFYCFDGALLFDALGKVDSNNAQGEFYLPDVIAIARDAGRPVIGLCAADASECLGVNTRVQLAQASAIMRDRINERHMRAGVTMLDPSSVWIGPEVQIDADVEILPNVMLMGSTSVGTGTLVGPQTRLIDTQVRRNCTIDETIAYETCIDDGCVCGPRAYLRPGTHLCEGAKVGTHVEIKKSTIGAHSKVPHLSYMGDTTMGKGVNIGAGSITCNYDGEKKWPTEIGDGAFIGSDTMMVAPVKIGAHSLVGAGSVITEDVPEDALALARSRQVVKPHWKASH